MSKKYKTVIVNGVERRFEIAEPVLMEASVVSEVVDKNTLVNLDNKPALFGIWNLYDERKACICLDIRDKAMRKKYGY